jgi:hypothetical protein
LEAYFDGEIADPEAVQRFEAVVREDAAAREQLHVYETLRGQLRRLPRTEAPPYLRKKVTYTISSRGRGMRAIRAVAPLVVASVALLVVVVGVLTVFRTKSPSLSGTDAVYAAMVADHEKYRPAPPDKEYFGDSLAEIEAWLAGRLGFAPTIPKWDWAKVQSARACQLNDTKVALVRFRCGHDDMSLYIWPADASASAPHHPTKVLDVSREYEIALWTRDDFVYGLVTARGSTSLSDRVGDVR